MKRKNKPSLKRQIQRHSKSKPEIEEHVKASDLIPMGSTLLNLAMSDHIEGGAKKGTMINVIGGSHGGKSMLALTSFAETNMLKTYDDYEFIYDDVERANSFPMAKLFGRKTAKRITAPRMDKDDPFSTTIQHFHANLKHWVKKEVPFIYVLDSFDALDAMEDQKKVDEMIDALEKEKQTAGTYGMAKAKGASSLFRNITSSLHDTKSLLIIISQVRDNVDPVSFQKETRSGGRALKFYAHHEMWLKSVGKIKKNGEIIGNKVLVKVTKSKINGKAREVEFDIYNSYGIDDIGSCIDYMLDKGDWTGGGSAKINHNGDLDIPNCTKPKMVKTIIEEGLQDDLRQLVGKAWNKFEKSLELDRNPKYN